MKPYNENDENDLEYYTDFDQIGWVCFIPEWITFCNYNK
jgi:hypothetical protein